SRDKNTGAVRYPYSTGPVGRLTYDSAGRMAAQLMDPGRRKVGGPPTRSSVAAVRDASLEDMRDILTGFTSYFGTFEIDESSRTVIHSGPAPLIPSWVGNRPPRNDEVAKSN